MADNYLVNVERCAERLSKAEAAAATAIAKEWIVVSPQSRYHLCANMNTWVRVERSSLAVSFPEAARFDWDKVATMNEAMSSAHLLYSLLCLFPAWVSTECWHDGYGVWALTLKHEATGELLHFADHKGAPCFWTKYSQASEAPQSFVASLSDLLHQVLVGCPHPYENVRAGSVG